MGMYDEIKNFAVKCPKCGGRVDSFQTKDLECQLNSIEHNAPGLSHFYDVCRNVVATKEDSRYSRPNWKGEWECATWISFSWEEGKLEMNVNDDNECGRADTYELLPRVSEEGSTS